MSQERLHPSLTFEDIRIAQLRAIAPEVFADGVINWSALRQALGAPAEEVDDEVEHFGLTWPGKREARRLAVVPSRGTLIPASGEGVDESRTRNVFIEGDNLEVLKLLQKSYAGRVKMIYIDPPYNTGNDFVYEDDFAEPIDAYLKRTGQADAEGKLLTTNTRADGRFHSKWLSMMYPRLRLARQLLKEDGLLFASIDDNELPNLRLLLNEIFGEEAFLTCFVWKRRTIPDSRNESKASTDHEYVLCYRQLSAKLRGNERNVEQFSNPDNDPRGPWTSTDLTGLADSAGRPNLHYRITNPATGKHYDPPPSRGWAISRDKFEKYIQENRILWPRSDTGRPRLKRFLTDAKAVTTSVSSLLDVGGTQEGTKVLQDIFGEKVLQFPKPLSLMEILLAQGSQDGDLIVDFFAGSGTTAQALWNLCRRDSAARTFILVQFPEPTGRDDYASIAEIAKERLRRVSGALQSGNGQKTNEDLGFRVFKLVRSHFRAWADYVGDNISEVTDLFTKAEETLTPGWRASEFLTEIMLLEGFPLDSRIKSLDIFKQNAVSEIVSEYREHRLFVCLDDKIHTDTSDGLVLAETDVFVCLDKAIDDTTKVRLSDRCILKTV